MYRGSKHQSWCLSSLPKKRLYLSNGYRPMCTWHMNERCHTCIMALRPFSVGLTGLCIPDGVNPSSRGSPRGFTTPSIDFVLRSSSRILSCFPRLHFAARPRLWRVLPLPPALSARSNYRFAPLSTYFLHALHI